MKKRITPSLFQTELRSFLEKNAPAHLLADTLSVQDFKDLGLSPYTYPREIQGLPPSKRFHDIRTLKKHSIDRAVLSLYEDIPLSLDASLVIFTWVMPPGLGDYTAQIEAAKILKEKYPFLKIQLITLLHRSAPLLMNHSGFDSHCILYENQEELKTKPFAEDVLKLFRRAPVILQIPTYYPHFKSLIKEISANQTSPQVEVLGEYGFINSSWCHPKTPYRCMGLHCLEKGVMIKKMPVPSWEILDRDLLGEMTLEEYRKTHRFFVGYLLTDRGSRLFLHALLKYLEEDLKNIDLCVTDIGGFLNLLRQDREFSLLKKYNIREIALIFHRQRCLETILPAGKRLRLIHMGHLPAEDFQRLFVLSEEFVACRGDQSFSEAVSADKVFFYDAPTHALPFCQDLVTLAEARIADYPGAIAFFKLFLDAAEKGEEMGALLQEDKTREGIKKLNRILREEYTVNPTLQNIVARALTHYHHPQLVLREKQIVDQFLKGKLAFKELIHRYSLLLQALNLSR